jgi:hypothetical protein
VREALRPPPCRIAITVDPVRVDMLYLESFLTTVFSGSPDFSSGRSATIRVAVECDCALRAMTSGDILVVVYLPARN